MRIGAWLLAVIVGVVAVGFAAYRLQQRSAFREKMRPIMEEDLADFAASPSGALMVNDSVSKRQKRIAQVKLYEAGRYREAKSRIVNLMEAENSFLTTAEEMREISDQVQIDESSTKAQQSSVWLSQNLGIEAMCSALQELKKKMTQMMIDGEVIHALPAKAQSARQNGVAAWNAAYGWVKWLGLDVEPNNPFRDRIFVQLEAISDNDLLKGYQAQSRVDEGIAARHCADSSQ